MPKRLGKFELPNRLSKGDDTTTDTFAVFQAEPFESGYGHTIGNALRRVLLSSIEGAAISSVKIEGVQHEFQSIEGIVEDVTDVVLNLKKILFVAEGRDTVNLIIDVEKEGAITAADIQLANGISVVNPEHVICNLNKKQRFFAELEVRVGRGYCPGEDNKKEDQPIGVIPIDSLFSPVKLVKYTVENTRVGQELDYDKLILEVTTDGRITPDEAIKQSSAILKHHLEVFEQLSDEAIEFENETKEISEEQNRLRKLLNMPPKIVATDLAFNCRASILSKHETRDVYLPVPARAGHICCKPKRDMQRDNAFINGHATLRCQ